MLHISQFKVMLVLTLVRLLKLNWLMLFDLSYFYITMRNFKICLVCRILLMSWLKETYTLSFPYNSL